MHARAIKTIPRTLVTVIAVRPIFKGPNKSLATYYVILPDLHKENIGNMEVL